MSKKKNTCKTQKHSKSLPGIVVLLLVIAAVLMAVALFPDLLGNTGEDPSSATGSSGIQISDLQDPQMQADKGLKIVNIGSYSGIFVEDGSDEPVTRILMAVVENIGNKTIQYAQIQLSDGQNVAYFSLSTLPPGESAVILEKNRMSYTDGEGLTDATIQNVVVFEEEPSLCEDCLLIQGLNGVLNVTNISNEDIQGDVVIYYKNASSDMLYGGITYRTTISGGIKAGEIKQITAGHYSEKGSRIMWVTVG